MNVYYVMSLSTIKKVTLQPCIDPPAKINWNLILLFQILKRCLVIFTLLTLIFQLFLVILMLESNIWRLKNWFSHNFLWLKACASYFLSHFYFFTKGWSLKNYEKCFLFHLKSSFHSRDIQIFVIFSFLSTLSRFKRANGGGIIYDVINWLA